MSLPSPALPAAPSALDARSPAERRSRRIGIALMCGALMCFACLDASGKWLNHHIPTLEIVWARYVGSAFVILAFVNPLNTPHMFATKRLGLQLLRSVLLFVSTAMNFFALRHLQLAETMSISFAMPILVALLAGPMLGEWVGPRRMAAILVGLVGVLIVTRPGGDMNPAVLYSIVGTLCYAIYAITTRMLAAHDGSRTTLAYSSLTGVLVMTPALPWIWQAPESALVWLVMGFTGFFGALGHWLLILAHSRAPAAIVAPFVYTQIIWMTALGFLVFGDLPKSATIIGAGVVMASGGYLLYRERAERA